MPDSDSFDLNRRGFLGAAAAGTGALVLAGCGADDGSPASNDASGRSDTRGTPKKGGAFRLGLSDSSSGDAADPLHIFGFATITISFNLYDRLMRPDPAEPEIVPSLAEEFTPEKNLKYYDVRLREAEWHDGKPVTADDVIFTLRRILNPKAPGGAAGVLAAIDAKRLQKLDSRTVRIHLNFPDAMIPTVMGHDAGTSIVPVGFDPENPIGSGPFKLESFRPGQRVTMTRNDNYWGDDGPYLDRLELVTFADPGTPRINALETGQIDGADHIDVALAPTVEGNSSLEMMISPSSSFIIWAMNHKEPPFDDVRVRQAIRLLADREQIVETALGGSRFAVVGNDIPSPQDPLYNDSLPQREQDIEQAKALLKQAGKEGVTVDLTVARATPGVVQTAQVLKQNARAAGVTININNVPDVTTYFTKNYFEDPFKFTYWQTVPMFAYIANQLLPTGAYNFTGYDDPQFNKLVEEARATLDFDKRKAFMDDAQKILYDTGNEAIFAFSHTVEAYNKKFAGFHTDLWGFSLNQLRFDTVYEV